MDIYNDERDNEAALILRRYSPDRVQDIIRLCQRKGGSVLSDIFASGNSGASQGASLCPYAILSREYVNKESFSSILLALDMIIVGEIRKPDFSNDRYQTILQNAFGLPRQLAEPVAKRIETFDVLGGLNPEGRSFLTKVTDRLKETGRRVANYAAGLLNLPWEIDQNQKYDVDFLYELKLLGDAAKEFNTRASLMQSQVAINTNLGLLQSGDIGDPANEDALAGEIGDILSRASLRNIPISMFGTMAPTMRVGASATQTQAAEVLDQSGVKMTPGKVEQDAPKNPTVAKIMNGIANANPSKALIAGLLTGAGGVLLKNAISSLAKSGHQATGDLYGEIGDIIGNDAAAAWAQGDIDGMISAMGDLAANDETTGDIDLDRQIEQVVKHQYGDIDAAAFGPQIGGIFTRMRTNVAKRTTARRGRRTTRRSARQYNKNVANEQLANALRHRNDDLSQSFSEGQANYDNGGGSSYQPLPVQQMDDNYMPGDYSQSNDGELPEFFGS